MENGILNGTSSLDAVFGLGLQACQLPRPSASRRSST